MAALFLQLFLFFCFVLPFPIKDSSPSLRQKKQERIRKCFHIFPPLPLSSGSLKTPCPQCPKMPGSSPGESREFEVGMPSARSENNCLAWRAMHVGSELAALHSTLKSYRDGRAGHWYFLWEKWRLRPREVTLLRSPGQGQEDTGPLIPQQCSPHHPVLLK